ncbi:hypothetical protein SUGI_0562600 [Cryptomeria japonica]|nr:hypothetical protein SUGI_0562600 [Cryptomeria japonica]
MDMQKGRKNCNSSLFECSTPARRVHEREASRAIEEHQESRGLEAPPPTDKPPPETVIVLKGLVKPSIEEEDNLEVDVIRRGKEDVEKRLGAVGIEPSASISIPNQGPINAIREKKERLRRAKGKSKRKKKRKMIVVFVPYDADLVEEIVAGDSRIAQRLNESRTWGRRPQ